MMTSVKELNQVAPWLSPVVLDTGKGDGALIREVREKLPTVLSGESREQYLVHVSPGTIQLARRDLQALDERMQKQEREERARVRADQETAFRKSVVALYEEIEKVLRELEERASWIIGDKGADKDSFISSKQAKRLLEEEPAIGQDLATLEFVFDETMTKDAFDFDTVIDHYDMLVKGGSPQWLFNRLTPFFDAVIGSKPAERRIRHWSGKSRRRMLKTCAELDWEPVLTRANGDDYAMAMVTLTYPGAGKAWLDYVPDAETAYRHFASFQERFYRAWGYRVTGIWKREFQRRGAPHLHILMLIPKWGLVREKRADYIEETELMYFREWCSVAWAEVVGAEGLEYVKHLAAGTGVDEIREFSSAKNVAGYFLKYAGKDGNFRSKEYQNFPPWEWSRAGKSVGRFWGTVGLQKEIRTVLVTFEEFTAFGRLLQRCCAAKFEKSYRFRKRGHSGWLLTDDLHGTVSLVKDLVRALQALGGNALDTPPVGMRGSVFSRLR